MMPRVLSSTQIKIEATIFHFDNIANCVLCDQTAYLVFQMRKLLSEKKFKSNHDTFPLGAMWTAEHETYPST